METTSHLAAHPLRGAVFENFIVAELLKKRFNGARLANMTFYRDRAGNEVDVVVDNGNALLPVEIKSSQTASPEFTKSLRYFGALFPDQVRKSLVVYDGNEEAVIGNSGFVNWRNLHEKI